MIIVIKYIFIGETGFLGSQLVKRLVKNDLKRYPSINFYKGLSKKIDRFLSNKEWLDNASSGKYKDYYLAQYGNK